MCDLYNSNDKTVFIKRFSTDRQVITDIFKAIAPKEKALRLDIRDMSLFRIAYIIQCLDSNLREYACQHDIFTKYIRCLNPSRDDVLSYNDRQLSTMPSNEGYVFSPENLMDYLDYIYDDVGRHSKSLLCRGVLWLALAGVPTIDECVKITINDFDDEYKYVRVNGIEYKIHPLSTDTFRLLSELGSFNSYRNNPYREYSKPRDESDLLFRSTSSSSKLKKEIVDLIYMSSKYSILSLSFGSVYKSGVCIRGLRNELLGVHSDRIFDSHIELKSKIKPLTKVGIADVKYSSIQSYRDWKRVLNNINKFNEDTRSKRRRLG